MRRVDATHDSIFGIRWRECKSSFLRQRRLDLSLHAAHNGGMTQLLTARAVAEQIGRHKSTVLRVAARHGIGVSAGPGTPVYFRAADVPRLAKLCRDKAGNPCFVEGNRFGVPPQKSRKSGRNS